MRFYSRYENDSLYLNVSVQLVNKFDVSKSQLKEPSQ